MPTARLSPLHPSRPLTADDLRSALAGFVGEIQQRPPAYSAIKQGGEAAYRKAAAAKPSSCRPDR